MRTVKVIMLHGSHTLGVLGATRVFDGEEDSKPNFSTFKNRLQAEETLKSAQFEVFFKVAVVNGEVECPSIEEEKVIELFTGDRTNRQGEQKPNNSPKNLGLKTQIESTLRVAIGNANLSTKKKALQELLELFAHSEPLSEPALLEILRLCNENPSIPQNMIDQMKGVICAD